MAKPKEIGKIFTYYSHIEVAGVDLSDTLKVGQTIHIKGHTTDFQQKVTSMQIDNKPVKEAKKGDSIGLKVENRVRPDDRVYKVEKEKQKV